MTHPYRQAAEKNETPKKTPYALVNDVYKKFEHSRQIWPPWWEHESLKRVKETPLLLYHPEFGSLTIDPSQPRFDKKHFFEIRLYKRQPIVISESTTHFEGLDLETILSESKPFDRLPETKHIENNEQRKEACTKLLQLWNNIGSVIPLYCKECRIENVEMEDRDIIITLWNFNVERNEVYRISMDTGELLYLDSDGHHTRYEKGIKWSYGCVKVHYPSPQRSENMLDSRLSTVTYPRKAKEAYDEMDINQSMEKILPLSKKIANRLAQAMGRKKKDKPSDKAA